MPIESDSPAKTSNPTMWQPFQQRSPSDQIRSLNRDGILDEQDFWQIVRSEKERADCSGMPVTVAIFSIKEDAKEHAHLTGWNAASLCRLLSESIRTTDHIGIAGANELGVVLWGTRELGAYRFINRLGENASWLATGCNLYVYPELKPLTKRTTGDISKIDGHQHSKNVPVPQRILNHITEIQLQLAAATDAKASLTPSLDPSKFDESHSFGFNDQAAGLLEEINDVIPNNQPATK